ncbi:MAG: pyruvate kinase [Myxococcales bacterium]|nr:pyruvate kinase [Myxococcales bacterium]
MRRAKIVCTLGPASREPTFIGNLIDEGMDVARINFSHGDPEDHKAVITAVRAEAEKRGRPVAVLQDLQGPKIRVGRFVTGSTELEPGADFTLTTREVPGTDTIVSTTYAGLPRDVKPGDVLLLDDGLLSLEVIESSDTDVETRVLIGGTLKNNKGINLPGVKVSAPALTEKDRRDLAFGMQLGVDFVALSFVRSPDDIDEAIALAKRPDGKRVPIIAKIEKPEAIERLEEIIDRADGIMVARGDLGVEMGAEKVPLIQKRAIELTNAKGKVVITATQMLESMITNARPTRAEASDVANAVLDGSDALMLSGETASGKYPLLAVRTMARIIEEIEDSARFKSRFDAATLDFATSANAIAKAAVVAARQMGATAIACVTESGGVARLVSEYRPEARLVAFSSQEDVYRRLALYWGVEPVKAEQSKSFDSLLVDIEKRLVAGRFAKGGDLVVLVVAVPIGAGISANTLHIHKIAP